MYCLQAIYYKQLELRIALAKFRTACELIISIINANDLFPQHKLKGGLIYRPTSCTTECTACVTSKDCISFQ